MNETGAVETNQFGDHYLPNVTGDIFKERAASEVLTQHYGDELFHHATFYVITGTDSGQLLNHLLKHELPIDSRYLFIETESVIKSLSLSIPKNFKNRVRVATTQEWLQTASSLSLALFLYRGRVIHLRSLTAKKGIFPPYKELISRVDRDLRHQLWRYQVELENPLFIENQLKNISENRLPASHLKDSFNDRTAVIIAGGPSLDSLLPWILKNQKSLTTIAVSRVSKKLHLAGLTPNIIVSIDPHIHNYITSKEMFCFWKESIFVYSSDISPELPGQWPGRGLYLGSLFPWEKNHNNISPVGPTVTNTALNLALYMGFKQIIFAGVDLCFSATGKSHASGSGEDATKTIQSLPEQVVETNSGGFGGTTNAFFEAIQTVHIQAQEAKKQGVQLINPAPYAAQIDGVEHTPVDNIELPKRGADQNSTLHELISPPKQELLEKHYASVEKELHKIKPQIQESKNILSMLSTYNQERYSSNPEKESHYLRKIYQLEKKLDHQYSAIMAVLNKYAIREVAHSMSLTPEDEMTENRQKAEFSERYYNQFLIRSDNLTAKVDEAIERIKNRKHELSLNDRLSLSFQQWHKDEQPGRAIILQNQVHALGVALPNDVTDRLSEIAYEFKEHNLQLDQRRSNDLNRAKITEPLFLERADSFYNHGNRAGLNLLINSLKECKFKDEKTILKIVEASVMEIDEKPLEALQIYSELCETLTEGLILIMALKRLFALLISLNDHANALTVLECLSQLDPAHLPQYTEELANNGKHTEAIDAYSHYVSSHPDDLEMMLKFGVFCYKIGVDKEAKWLFQHILEKDPENREAKEILKLIESS